MKSIKFFSGLTRPSFAILGVLLVASSISLSSCSDDDNDGGDQDITLETPAYEDVSAKYEITSGASGISSIELTASGNYIIISDNAPYYIAKKDRSYGDGKAFGNMFAGISPATRATTGHISGKFIKISDTEFILEGYGSIVIEGSADNAFSIKVTKQGEGEITLTANKAATISDTPMSNALCRTWNIDNIRMTAVYNGKSFFDKTRPANEYAQLMNDLDNAFKSYFDDDEGISDGTSYGYSQFIFTKAGTYIVTTTDNQLGISMWKWKDESKGLLRYTHIYDDFDAEGANDASISFSGSTMKIEETNMDYSDPEEGSLKIQSFYECSEAK